MKRSRAYKTYSTWRQRELRFLALALTVGVLASGIIALVVYLASRGGHAY